MEHGIKREFKEEIVYIFWEVRYCEIAWSKLRDQILEVLCDYWIIMGQFKALGLGLYTIVLNILDTANIYSRYIVFWELARQYVKKRVKSFCARVD